MRLLSLIIIAASISFSSFAQSNDDFSDTRTKKESFEKQKDKIFRSDLSGFTLAGIDESIGKSEMEKIPYSEYGTNFMTFEANGIKATVTTAPFVTGKHKMDYDEKYLIKIDKKPYYGNYGKLPLTMIKSITLTINGDSVNIPPSAYFDLYNLNFTFKDKQGVDRSSNGIYHSRDGHRLYLYLLCRDNSGSYEVTFVIQDKKYAFRVLDYGFM